MVVTQLDPISVVFSTPEDNLPRIAGRLNSGAELKVTVFDRANVNALATGTLTTYDSQVDVTTGTIRMRATFDNPNGALFPQQFVNVRLLVDTQKGVALAPNAAIQIGPSGNFVYLLNDDGTVSKRDVVSGPTDGKVTTITEGLASGDKVVIDGVDRLRDGAKVRLADVARRLRKARDRVRRRGAIPAARAGQAADHRRSAPGGQGAGGGSGTPARGAPGSEGPTAGGALVNPSRIFIDRPVATSLMMIAILLVGLAAYRFLPLSALPEVDYPTIQVQTFYPGASPEVMTSAVTAPLERQFGQMPSLSQMMSASSAGSSVITLRFGLDISLDIAEQQVQAAINAAGNLLPADLPAPPIYSKVNPADAPILTLGVASDTMKLTDVEDLIESRLAPKLSQLPGVGLVTHIGRPSAGGAHPRQSAGPGRLRRESRRPAHDDQQSQRQHAQGQFRRAGAIVDDQRQRSDPRPEGLSEVGRRLPERRADPALRRRHRRDGAGKQPAFGLDEHDAGAHRQYPAPAGRERHSGRRRHQGGAAGAERQSSGGSDGQAPDRPHDDDPGLGQRRRSSNWRSPSASS